MTMNDNEVQDLNTSKLDSQWNDRAWRASLHFCVFKKDVHSPMSDASLARLFFVHIPDAVRIDETGEQAASSEARFLSRRIEQDMVVGRDYDRWLAGYNHINPETRAMFARGKENSLNRVLDRLAEIGGFEREDILIREKNEDLKALSEKRVVSLADRQKNSSDRAAAMKSLGMNSQGF